MRDLHGKYSFSNDVIFNENISGRLGVSHPLSHPSPGDPPSASPCPAHDKLHTHMAAGQVYDKVLQLKALRTEERVHRQPSALLALYGGVDTIPIIEAFQSLIAISTLLTPSDVGSLALSEPDILWHHFSLSLPDSLSLVVFKASSPCLLPGVFDLTNAPSSYPEALAHSDASVWTVAIDREKQSLLEMGAFEEADLPPGECAVGLKWVYDFKTDSMGGEYTGKGEGLSGCTGF